LTKDILVAILEEDVFSRNWMALLMVRDWRTRVIGEFSTRADMCAYLESSSTIFDVLIVDVDLLGEYFTIHEICQSLVAKQKTAKILLTGIEPDPKIIREMREDRVHGYVLKGEIGYSLSWVITFVYEGYWVLTPGIQNVMLKLPPNALVLDGRKTIPGFTDHEAEVARMAFIFSVGRRDLADELRITEQWSYGLVSELYKKMGLTEIISGEVDLFAYIGESAIIRKKFDDIIEQLGTSKKARDMETLAYHLLTMPEIIQ
jgi:DNA-binding NarL/FixJ family response regulator